MVTRVMLLTQWFDPEPTFKGLVFARALVELGFEVEVVTGFPNYPGGRLYDGYKMKFLQRETVQGISVTRVPLYPSHGNSALGRVFNYVSFAASSLLYGLFGARRPDVIYVYHPPLTVAMAAVMIKMFRKTPVVCDVQDMWPDTLRATGMLNSQRALNVIEKVCKWVYRRADRIVVLSPGFKKILLERGVPEAKVEVIYNWCSEKEVMTPVDHAPRFHCAADRFKVLFAGNMGRAQGLDSVVEAAQMLQDQNAPVTFFLLGAGLELQGLQERVRLAGLDNVKFMPAVPMAEVGAYLCQADALLVHLKKDPLFTITIPSKTQAYMAVGKPLIMAVDGDAASLVSASDCGVIAQSEDPASLAQAVMTLLDASPASRAEMGEKGRSYYLENLSLDQGSRKFSRIFLELATRNA